MSTWFATIAAPLALFGAGLAIADGTRSQAALPDQPSPPAAAPSSTAQSCQPETPKGSALDGVDTAKLAGSVTNGANCSDTPSPDQAQAAQSPAVQAPTAFTPGLPLGPFLAVPAGAASLVAAAANDSAG